MIYKYGWKVLGFNSYQEYLTSEIWQEKKKQYLEKNKECSKCGTTKGL